jgi:hypothetical protein
MSLLSGQNPPTLLLPALLKQRPSSQIDLDRTVGYALSSASLVDVLQLLSNALHGNPNKSVLLEVGRNILINPGLDLGKGLSEYK